MNKDAIDVLPKLLKRLSNEEGLNIPNLSKEYGIPKNTLADNINNYLCPIVIADIKYDHSTKNWTARKNFLSETLLSADEMVVISILEKSSSKYGDGFLYQTKKLFARFRKRASLSIFKKIKMERLNDREETNLAIVKNAIKEKMTLTCDYHDKARHINPLKIVLLEGYWYLFLWDVKDNVMKKFYFKDIKNLRLEGSFYDDSKQETINKIDGAINAYFKDKESFEVELEVHKKVSIYFKRLPLSKSQKFFPSTDDDYEKMTIMITDEREIIPTIQSYLPYIKVISPQTLDKKIRENIANYSNSKLS